MTTLNFALTRAAARTFRAGDEILVTKLDHDGNVSPWLELAHDLDLKVGFVELHDDTTLDYDDLERKLTDRTRVVAFPLASNAVGTLTDVPRIVELAQSVGALDLGGRRALRPARPDRRRRARRRRAALLAVQVLRPAPRARLRPRRRRGSVAHVQGAAGRPSVRDRDACARASRRLRRHGRVHRVARLGADPGARASARAAVPRRAAGGLHAARAADDGRTRADIRVHGRRPLAARGRGIPRRARHRSLGRQLLRRRGDGRARSRGSGRRARRLRALQHRGGGRPPSRRPGESCDRSRRTPAGADPVRHDESARERGGVRRAHRGAAARARHRVRALREDARQAQPDRTSCRDERGAAARAVRPRRRRHDRWAAVDGTAVRRQHRRRLRLGPRRARHEGRRRDVRRRVHRRARSRLRNAAAPAHPERRGERRRRRCDVHRRRACRTRSEARSTRSASSAA